jgi:maleamate amidohydrolase
MLHTRLERVLGFAEGYIPSMEQLMQINITKKDVAHLRHIKSVRDVALLVVDVQKKYCDPMTGKGTEATDSIAARIGSITPAFRAAGVPVFAIYFEEENKPANFHRFMPDLQHDRLLRKEARSAFNKTDLHNQLKALGIKHVLLCGFNLSACVKDSANDAILQNYTSYILGDLCDDNEPDFYPEETTRVVGSLRMNGIKFVHSKQALQHLKSLPRLQ